MSLAETAPPYLWPSVPEALFLLFGVVALVAAVLVVTTNHLVHAALWLVVTLVALAAEFLLLSAEFVAWVQVLIYVGAVVVLLLFGLMLTRAPTGPSSDLNSSRAQRVAAGLVASATAAVLVTVVVDAFARVWIDLPAATAERSGGATAVGGAVFRYWVLPFEALSVLLLAALIGAIVISRARPPLPGEHTEPPGPGAG